MHLQCSFAAVLCAPLALGRISVIFTALHPPRQRDYTRNEYRAERQLRMNEGGQVYTS